MTGTSLYRALALLSAVTTFCGGSACAAPPHKANLQALTPASTTAPLRWRPLDEPGNGGWMVGMRISPHDSHRMLVTGDMLGVGLSVDGGQSWQATYGFKSWEMGDITWHPTDPMTVWVGGVMGPYVSHDGGLHWTEKRNGMPPPLGLGHSAPVEKVLFDPNAPRHLIALGGSSRRWDMIIPWDKVAFGVVWQSMDGGDTWTKLTTLTPAGASPAPDAKGGVNIVSGGFGASSSEVIYAGLDGHGVWVSEDGGKTWADRTAGLPHGNVERVIPHPTDARTVFVSLDNHQKADKTFESGGVYKSVDAGLHWTSLNTGLRQNTGTDVNLVSRYKGFALCEADPNVMYVSDWSYDMGVSSVSTDGGAHWRPAVTKNNFGVKDAPRAQAIVHLENSQPAGLCMTVFTVDPHQPTVAYGLSSDSASSAPMTEAKHGQDSLSVTMFPPRAAPEDWRGRGYTGWCAMNIRFNPYKPGQSTCSKPWTPPASGSAVMTCGPAHVAATLEHSANPWGGGLDDCDVYPGRATFTPRPACSTSTASGAPPTSAKPGSTLAKQSGPRTRPK